MKRKILSVLSVLMAVLMSTAALSACNKAPAGADSSGGSGESVSESSESERSESFAEHAKELTAQIHGNAVWLEDSAAAYEANRDALWNTPIETNGAVIRCNSEEVFVYDAESGKLRYKAENYGETIRAEAYSARDGYDYRLLLLDSVVYRSTTDESKVLRETLPLDMKFEHCDAREFRDCYDINEQYFTWHDDDGIRLLSLDGGEPELIQRGLGQKLQKYSCRPPRKSCRAFWRKALRLPAVHMRRNKNCCDRLQGEQHLHRHCNLQYFGG